MCTANVTKALVEGANQLKKNTEDGTRQLRENVNQGAVQTKANTEDGVRQLRENVNQGAVQTKENVVDGTRQLRENINQGSGQLTKNLAGSTMPNPADFTNLLPDKNVPGESEESVVTDSNSPEEVAGILMRRRRAKAALRYGFFSTLKQARGITQNPNPQRAVI